MAQYLDSTPVLTELRWEVIGGVATRMYMPERATEDFDIVVRQEDGEEVRRKLAAAGFRCQSELAMGRSSWLSQNGTGLDVVQVETPWLAEALEQAQHNRDASGTPVLSLAYLVLMKFLAGRVQDLADVTRMLGQADAEMLDRVRQVYMEYLLDDIDDLENLISLGQLEADPP